MAVVGVALRVMITSSIEEQLPLTIVQRNVFAPTPKLVMPEVGLLGVVIEPEPPTKVHVPVPTEGVLPANVAVVAHTV